MTDERIIKAWEKCSNPSNDCYGDDYTCEYSKYAKGTGECFKQLRKDVTDLINRQKAEIAKLQIIRQRQANIIGEEHSQKFELSIKLGKANENLEKSIKTIDGLMAGQKTLIEEVKNAKSEAIKEFAEEIKQVLELKDLEEYNYVCKLLNVLVKEMKEGVI